MFEFVTGKMQLQQTRSVLIFSEVQDNKLLWHLSELCHKENISLPGRVSGANRIASIWG